MASAMYGSSSTINTRTFRPCLHGRNISSAYRKSHTCWQHRAGLTGGRDLQRPARTSGPPHRIAGVLVLPGIRRPHWRHMLATQTRAAPKWESPSMGASRTRPSCSERLAPRFGVVPTITDAAVSDANLELALGNRCISVSHKTQISGSILLALRQAGVRYVSTRSVGYNHIDVQCAERAGHLRGNVAYSPDSVADYTLMLMLMAGAQCQVHHQPRAGP